MTEEKLISEVETLREFVQTYCNNKHDKKNICLINKNIQYKNLSYTLELNLCKECEQTIDYSIQRLYECPYEIKPRCRKCTSSCYEKPQWKAVAKIMMYSGIILGLSKIKNKFKR